MAAIKVLSGSLPVSRPGWTAASHPLPTTAHRHGCSDVSRCRQTVLPWGEGRAPPRLPAACGRVLRHCQERCGPQCRDVLVKQPAAQKHSSERGRTLGARCTDGSLPSPTSTPKFSIPRGHTLPSPRWHWLRMHQAARGFLIPLLPQIGS